MQGSKHSLDGLAALLLLMLCASWGVQQVSIKLILTDISPVMQAALRSAGATVLLIGWMKARGRAIFDRDDTLLPGICAGLLFAGEFALIFWGLEFTHASRAVVFLYLSPFVVAIGAQLFIPGEHLKPLQVVGLIGAFAGILVAFGESMGGTSEDMLIGDAMLIGAAILWGATTVLIKASKLATIAPSKTLLYQLAVSAPALAITSFLLGEPGIMNLSSLALYSMAYQTIWVAFITYAVWFWLVRHYPASRLASFTFLTPIFGVVAGAVLLGEPLSASLLVALGLIAIGIYLVNRPETVAKNSEVAIKSEQEN